MSNSRLLCNWPVQSSGCLTSYFLAFIKCAGPGPGSYDHASATGSFDHMLKLPKIKSKLASVKSKAQRLSLAHTVTDRLAKCRVQWKFVHCSHCMRPSLGDQALNKCRIHCERQTALYSHAFWFTSRPGVKHAQNTFPVCSLRRTCTEWVFTCFLLYVFPVDSCCWANTQYTNFDTILQF